MGILDELEGQEGFSLDELEMGSTRSRATNLPTSQNRSAYASFLLGDASSYSQILSEEEIMGDSPTLEEIERGAIEEEKELIRAGAIDFISDEAEPLESRIPVAQMLQKNTLPEPDPREIAHERMLASADPGVNEEKKQLYTSLSQALNDLNEHTRNQQAILNSAIAESDASTVSALADFAEQILPFMDQGVTASALKGVREMMGKEGGTAKAFLLLGEAKAEIVETYQSLPYEEQARLLPAIKKVIDTASTVSFTGRNDMSRFNFLRDIVEGDYSDFERRLDDLVGVLDATIIGGIAVRGAKSVLNNLFGPGTELAFKPGTREYEGFSNYIQEAASTERGALPAGPKALEENPAVAVQKDAVDEALAELKETSSKAGDASVVRQKKQAVEKAEDKVARSEKTVEEAFARVEAAPLKGKKVAEEDWIRARAILETDKAALESAKQAVKKEDELQTVKKRLTRLQKGGSSKTFDKRVNELIDARVAQMLYEGAKSEALRDAILSRYRSSVSPVSLSYAARRLNPELSRSFFKAIDEGDDTIAGALYGTSREEALADELLMGPENLSGVAPHRTPNIEGTARPSQEVIDELRPRSNIDLTELEKEKARSRAFNDFTEVNGLTVVPSMSSVGSRVDTPTGVNINLVYSRNDGPFLTPEQAREETLFALRGYGVRSEEVEVLGWTPEGFSANGGGIDGGFVARVNFPYQFNPSDAGNQKFTYSLNFFDRFPQLVGDRVGSLSRFLIDPGAMLPPEIMRPAYRAADKAARAEEVLMMLGSRFTKSFKTLSKQDQQKVDFLIREANHKRKEITPTDVMAAGLPTEAVETMSLWREIWDTHWHYENSFYAMDARGRGFEVFTSPDGAENILVKKAQGKEQYGQAYNPISRTFETVGPNNIDEIKAQGGVVVNVRNVFEVNGTLVEKLVVRESPSSGYLRQIRNDDKLLPYIPGYFTKYYNSPIFVVRRHKGQGGKTHTQAIAVAGNSREAEQFARTYAGQNGLRFGNDSLDSDIFYRGDLKRTASEVAADTWDIAFSAGRTAQRHRGRPLIQARGDNQISGDRAYTDGPVDSMISSVMSLSRRIGMKQFIETNKARWIEQFGDLSRNKGMFPSSSVDIKGVEGRPNDARIRDARTAWEYINYMENGYRNNIDDSFKAVMNYLASIAGGKGKPGGIAAKSSDLAENFLQTLAEARGPEAMLKSAAFYSMIALNPFRQALLQAHQLSLTTFVNPAYLPQQFVDLHKLSLMLLFKGAPENILRTVFDKIGSYSEAKKMLDDFERSGLAASIDRNSLIDATMSELSEKIKHGGGSGLIAKGSKPFAKVGELGKALGFKPGEIYNLLGTWLVFRDKAMKNLRPGESLSEEALEEIAAKTRAFTFGMNVAGDAPYSRVSGSTIFQFLSVPHKALLLPFNKTLDVYERFAAMSYSFLMFGVPTPIIMALWGDDLPEDEEARRVILEGGEEYVTNTILSWMAGDDVRVDMSALSPMDAYGVGALMVSFLTLDIPGLISNSPAGSLFFGDPNRSRISRAAKKMMELTEAPNWSDPRKWSETLEAFLRISSGYSNYAKAKVIWETNRVYNSLGGEEIEANKIEAIGQFFGLPPSEYTNLIAANQVLYRDSKAFEEDVKHWLKSELMDFVSMGEMDSPERRLEIMRMGNLIFKDNPSRAKEIIKKELSKMNKSQADKLMTGLLRYADLQGGKNIEMSISALPVEEEKKKRFLERLKDFKKASEEE